MSNKHSLGAYRILIQLRSSRTIMVEGKDDKELFLKLRSESRAWSGVVIDSADILKRDELQGLGAKARVDVLVDSIAPGSLEARKLRCVVDREWEALVDEDLEPVAWSPPATSGVRYTTSGHSIENYSFYESFVATYLKHFGSGVATPDFLKEVEVVVPELLRYAAAFSELARKNYIISRCASLFDWSDLSWDGNRITAEPKLIAKLEARNVPDAEALLRSIATNYNGKWRTSMFANDAHYHAHGHLGEEILWAGIGGVAAKIGYADLVAREIAQGRRDERKRVWHGWLVRQDASITGSLTAAFL